MRRTVSLAPCPRAKSWQHDKDFAPVAQTFGWAGEDDASPKSVWDAYEFLKEHGTTVNAPRLLLTTPDIARFSEGVFFRRIEANWVVVDGAVAGHLARVGVSDRGGQCILHAAGNETFFLGPDPRQLAWRVKKMAC